jgi:hypothetical protein
MHNVLPQALLIARLPPMFWFEKNQRKKRRRMKTTAKKARMTTVTAIRSERDIATDRMGYLSQLVT